MLLVALIFTDSLDLRAFNSRLDIGEDVVLKEQQLLDAWHYILQFT